MNIGFYVFNRLEKRVHTGNAPGTNHAKIIVVQNGQQLGAAAVSG